MEFKYEDPKAIAYYRQILIESQWNLNNIHTVRITLSHGILIESQWNLNEDKKLIIFAEFKY